MTALPNSKAFWRSHHLALRSQLSVGWMQEAQQQLLHQAAQLPFPIGLNVLTYLPLPGRNEPDPLPWIQWLQQRQPDLKVLFPVVTNPQAGVMEAVLPKSGTSWVAHAWGMQQPAQFEVISPEEIDMVITPLLAVDMRGHRVGYGKGFYDRFFARCAPHLMRVGLSWFTPVPTIADIGPNDIPLSHCVTPQQLYVF